MTRVHKQGFTIVELTLSIAFISVLLLAIVFAAINAGGIYNKGLVIESVNQAGRDIGDTLRRDFLQTKASVIAADLAEDPVIIDTEVNGEVISGRFCLGGYSYLWNNPRLSGGAESDLVVSAASAPVNFVRVADRGKELCQRGESGRYVYELGGEREITHLLKQEEPGSVGLAMYAISIAPVVDPGEASEGLFLLRYTIGTGQASEMTIATGDQSCRPPSDDQANNEFCAINNFEVIVRTNG